jgi:hypothetical protein
MKKGVKNTKCEKIMEKMGKECFIQPAIAREEKLGHKGYTHKLLGIPEDYNLSHAETLLEKIVDTSIGKTVINPLEIGRRKYKVTTDMKRHVNFALNLIRIAQGKGKRKK